LVDAPIRFQVGARTLVSVPRRLIRIGWTLDEVLAGYPRALPPIGDADGFSILSLPEDALGAVAAEGCTTHIRQRYLRYHTDLSIGHAAWLAQMSGNARSVMKRKARRLADAGQIEIRGYRTAAELADFHALARPLARRTYQEKLLGSALPGDAAFLGRMAALGEADTARAWLLLIDGRPAAYLWCSAQGSALRYDYVGHDPAFAALSPGSVLHAEAMRQLFEDRFAYFDFTEGEGQHKRQFATGGTPCVDLLLLRASLANRATLAALARFDGAMTRAKTLAASGLAKRVADRLRRA
jgi:CelD/BcsL family acetyltransferase involved in cellulose biosynthesis